MLPTGAHYPTRSQCDATDHLSPSRSGAHYRLLLLTSSHYHTVAHCCSLLTTACLVQLTGTHCRSVQLSDAHYQSTALVCSLSFSISLSLIFNLTVVLRAHSHSLPLTVAHCCLLPLTAVTIAHCDSLPFSGTHCQSAAAHSYS